MSRDDPFVTLAVELTTPVEPRADFAAALLDRLLVELRTPAAAHGRVGRERQESRRWRPWLAPRRPRRVAALVIVLLLLLVGVAAATYLDLRPWVSTTPRGAQVAASFRLTDVYRARPDAWMDLFPSVALSADGHDLLFERRAQDGTERIFRVHGADGPHPSAPQPILDLGSVPSGVMPDRPAWDGLAPAPGGDLFVLGGSRFDEPLAASVMVVHPDRSTQAVVSYRELRRRGLIEQGLKAFVSDNDDFTLAASAPGRLWLSARVLHRPIQDGWPYDVSNALFEVIDPNGDGDWSDRVVRRLRVPGSMPGFRGHHRFVWWTGLLVAERPLPGDGAAGSVLLPMTALLGYGTPSTRFEYRVYRLRDRNDDGDLDDPGETTVVFRRQLHRTTPAQLASRLTADGTRELVVMGLTGRDRISLIGADGRVTDIGRSFPGWGTARGLLAGPTGEIHAVLDFDQGAAGAQLRVYRLSPTDRTSAPVAPEAHPRRVQRPAGAGPLLAAETEAPGVTDIAASTVLVQASGRRTGEVSSHAGDVCESTDRRAVAFTSDAAVPREPFVYVARVGGGPPRKISEQAVEPVCPFDGRHLLLASRMELPDGTHWTVVGHDLATGHETTLASLTPRYTVSPDGRRLAVLEPSASGERLVVVDVTTGRRRVVAALTGGLRFAPSTSYSASLHRRPGTDLAWSPDGTRIAVVTGRGFDFVKLSWGGKTRIRPRPYRVLVTHADGTGTQRVATLRGGPPVVWWSPDGTRLLACLRETGPDIGCTDPSSSTWQDSVLHLLDTRTRSDAVVARGLVYFVGWQPGTGTYAWADDTDLHLSTGRTVPLVSGGADWVGWSPDGRFLALGPRDGYAILDVASRKLHRWNQDDNLVYTQLGARWWQR